MIYFYSHLVKYESLMGSLDELELSSSQKNDLAQIIDTSLYHMILDLVLSNLSAEDKKQFMILIHDNKNRDEIMGFLNEKINNIEDLITEASENLKEELHQDIKEAKRIKK